ncbi:hypothetical protein KDW61_20995 [Burkholderia cenocepacia]|uniref:hypothetical protein n=1 Tax=Burkholderia cenocepacia TaxID=95486 RepID=UPI001B9E2C4D|nr:hypothetical protein [Burkholderia cenocepacia]MBR8211142.1 hypothetical protein [Burkholderia cenocepacia]
MVDLLEQLPASLRSVPLAVQEMTGISVTIQKINEDAVGGEFARASAVLDVDPDNNAVTIWVDPGSVSSSSVAHEVIHLRRNVVESVPKLFPSKGVSPAVAAMVWGVENDLEHMMIIPEEITAFPEARDWWIDHYEIKAARPASSPMEMSLHWALLRNLFPDEIELAQRYAARLRSSGDLDLIKIADYLREDFKNSRPHKRTMIEKLFDIFPGMREHANIGQYVMDGGRLVVRALS